MEKQKHTPRPWKVRKPGMKGYFIATVSEEPDIDIVSEKSPEGNDEADANLIAAAPELLEACKVGVVMLRELNEGHACRTIETMNEIIAKAEGDK